MEITRRKIVYAVFGLILWPIFIFIVRHAGGRTEEYLEGKLRGKLEEKLDGTSTRLWLRQRYKEFKYLAEPVDIEVAFDYKVWIRPGDKVYLVGIQREGKRVYLGGTDEVGVVWAVNEDITKKWLVHIRMYPEAIPLLGPDSTFKLVMQPNDFGWVTKKLFPQERIESLKREFNEYMKEHAPELKALFEPELTALINDSYEIVKERFPDFLNRQKGQFSVHLTRIEAEQKINDDLDQIGKTVLPMLSKECQKEFQPIFDQMLERFPKGQIAWAWMKDLVSEGEPHVKETLNNYIEKEVRPILESEENQKRLKDTVIKVLKESSQHPDVKHSIHSIQEKILGDEQFIYFLRSLVVEFYREIKGELLQKVREKFTTDEFKEKLKFASATFENTLIRMVNEVAIESDSSKIRIAFAMVLRRQVFYKDCFCIEMSSRWLPFIAAMGIGEQGCIYLPTDGRPKQFLGRE